MTEDQDNAGEVVASAVRVALTAAGQLAEQVARRRQADLREAERDSAARVATLQSQLAAERELVLRSVRDVIQRGDSASVQEVVRAWEQARSWDGPTMGIERAQLEHRIRERFGVDIAIPIPKRTIGEQTTATALVAHDIERQAGRPPNLGPVPGRAAEGEGWSVLADVDEALAARSIAAKSHPTLVAQSTRNPQASSNAKYRTRSRGTSAQVQGPSR